MSYIRTYLVNGYEIRFSDFGIILDPATSDFDDPDFIEALKEAQAAYDNINNVHYIEEYGEAPSLQGATREALEGLLERCQKAEQQTSIDLWPNVIHSIANIRNADGGVNNLPANRAQRIVRSIKKPGYVYLLKSQTGYYKIGKAKNPEDRLTTFHVKLPFDVEFECVFKCEDMKETEKYLHARFANKRINGEWFELNEDDIAYIKSLKRDADGSID